ncbi:MAG: hypothetical protein KFH98_05090 [Gemmatimonadetes bacterium]|nr:hypothetical protein [Gemmatimonadota bacterium]
MAKTDAGKRAGGGSWISVTVAVVAVAAFFGWIATREPPQSVAVAEPNGSAVDTVDTGAPATVITTEQLSETATARSLIGQNVELESVKVLDHLGPQMFWIEMPGGAPYLVKMDEALVSSGRALPQREGLVRLVGRLLEKTPAVLDSWTESGALESADDRSLAEFGSTFIEARRVEPAGG